MSTKIPTELMSTKGDISRELRQVEFRTAVLRIASDAVHWGDDNRASPSTTQARLGSVGRALRTAVERLATGPSPLRTQQDERVLEAVLFLRDLQTRHVPRTIKGRRVPDHERFRIEEMLSEASRHADALERVFPLSHCTCDGPARDPDCPQHGWDKEAV